MTSKKSLRVLLIMGEATGKATFLLDKLTRLIDRGLDVQALSLGQVSVSGELARRICSSVWAPGLWSRPLRALRLLRAAGFRGCVRVYRYLVASVRSRGLGPALRALPYEVEIAALAGDIAHFEFGVLARRRIRGAVLAGVPAIVSFRGYDLNFLGLGEPNYYDEVWDAASGLHFLGNDLLSRARTRGLKDTRLVRLIPPSVDLDYFTPPPRAGRAAALGSPDAPLRLLSVARLTWKKGLEYGLSAVRLMLDAGVAVDYRIVGDGDYFDAVAFAVSQLGLQGRVELVGHADRPGIRDQLEWADVMMHPAVSEGFCNAVVEAQAMQVPVVCTDADGLAENVEHGRSGFVVRRRDPRALAQAVMRLAEDGPLRIRMGQGGRLRALTFFDVRQQISQFVAMYEEVLAAPPSVGA